MARVGPVYESIVGVSDLDAALVYWTEFGFRPIATGSLDAAAAQDRYGWHSGVRSVRLQNGDSADHGLLRLMAWDLARPGSLSDWPTISLGMHWSAALVSDVVDLFQSYEEGRSAGERWVMSTLTRGWMGPESAPGFARRPVVMREFMVTGPETKQVLFGRTRFTREGYGTIHPDSPRGVSEFTHSGLVLPLDDDLAWFTGVLGLTIVDQHDLGPQILGGDRPLGLRPDQVVSFTRLTADGAPAGLLFTFQPRYSAPDARPLAAFGSCGVAAFSFRGRDLEQIRTDSLAIDCPAVSSIAPNEFGEPSIHVVSPDGSHWTIVG